MQYKNFANLLSTKEPNAWDFLVHGFLGNHKDKKYEQDNAEKLSLRVSKSLKIHFLHSYLDFCPGILGRRE